MTRQAAAENQHNPAEWLLGVSETRLLPSPQRLRGPRLTLSGSLAPFAGSRHCSSPSLRLPAVHAQPGPPHRPLRYLCAGSSPGPDTLPREPNSPPRGPGRPAAQESARSPWLSILHGLPWRSPYVLGPPGLLPVPARPWPRPPTPTSLGPLGTLPSFRSPRSWALVPGSLTPPPFCRHLQGRLLPAAGLCSERRPRAFLWPS